MDKRYIATKHIPPGIPVSLDSEGNLTNMDGEIIGLSRMRYYKHKINEWIKALWLTIT